jgi:hypothetical protein
MTALHESQALTPNSGSSFAGYSPCELEALKDLLECEVFAIPEDNHLVRLLLQLAGTVVDVGVNLQKHHKSMRHCHALHLSNLSEGHTAEMYCKVVP